MKIFVVHARYESYGFAAFASLDKAKADPKAHPMEMMDTDWDEQLDDYIREQRDRAYARRAAMRRARGGK